MRYVSLSCTLCACEFLDMVDTAMTCLVPRHISHVHLTIFYDVLQLSHSGAVSLHDLHTDLPQSQPLLFRNKMIKEMVLLVFGTRGIVVQLHPNVAEMEKVDVASLFLPSIRIVSSVKSKNLICKRRQFPIKSAFSMTINIAEGQTLLHII